jgi:hypothetical protein
MTRIEILKKLNEYFVNDEKSSKQNVVELMNLMVTENTYKENLDLFFMSISLTQLYGFLAYLTIDERNYFFLSDYFKANSYSSQNLDFLNSGQLSLLNEIDVHYKSFISAPTSFGKTSIVNEYIINKLETLNVVVYIVPTNSLLEEQYIKYTNFLRGNHNINISTQPIKIEGCKNILFLTPERFVVFYEGNRLDNVDLIVMDETYKIMEYRNKSISDFINTRGIRFRKVADILGNSACKTIFLSPFTYDLTDSMRRFLKKYNIAKIDRKIEYVSHNTVKIESVTDFKICFPNSEIKYETQNMFKKTSCILQELLNEKNIVYVRYYSEAYKIADEFPISVFNVSRNQRFIKFLKHLDDNLCIDKNTKWKVISSLEKGIGIYISPIPRYIKREIIKLFEENALHTLIVTTSFTEGVNTNAKNLIFTTLQSGRNALSSIDVLNVAGRAGRFGKNSIGDIYCITKAIYDRVSELQDEGAIRLENYNYFLNQEGNPKGNLIDFEIDMMGDDFLNDDEKIEKKNIDEQIAHFGLSRADLNVSLNISNKWKLYLYDYFIRTRGNIDKYYNAILNLLDEKHKVDSIEIIFIAIRECFRTIDDSINPFPGEIYDISAFDKSGNFTWGRLYSLYVSGTNIEVIRKNKSYIQKRYNEVMKNRFTKDPEHITGIFKEAGAYWILQKYYDKDCITVDYDAFYTEAFKFMSSVIQYKIPYYVSFFISVFKLYLSKKSSNYDISKIDLKKIVMSFEDGIINDDKLRRLIDYGISNDIISKIKENDINVDSIVSGDYNKSLFDEFEQLLLEDFATVMK